MDGPWGSMVSQPNEQAPGPNERPCLKKQGRNSRGIMSEADLWPLYACAVMFMHAHTYIYTRGHHETLGKMGEKEMGAPSLNILPDAVQMLHSALTLPSLPTP